MNALQVTHNLLPDKAKPGFVELLARTNFSFLQGGSHPEEMVEQAIRFGYSGIGVCDLNGLYGIVRGYQAAKSPSQFVAAPVASHEFKYLFSCEFTLVDQSNLVLMPINKQGYAQLCHLVTVAKRNAEKSYAKIELKDIENHCSELLAFALPPWNESTLQTLVSYFGDRLYLPVWRDFTWESREFYKQALRWQQELGIPTFATQRPFMHSPERKPLFDVLTCIHHQVQIDEAEHILTPNAERHLRPLENLYEIWGDHLELLQKTLHIASRIEFSLDQLRYKYPSSHLPQGTTTIGYMRKLVQDGLQQRFNGNIPIKVQNMVDYELNLIADLQYEDYFLTLFEICQFARSKNILFQGRGSAANSVVCFALGLTAVDPTKIDLLFERFLSKERGEPPDIDIDFEHERREEVIQHIYQKYGSHHAAMVCTIIRYRSRMSLRETAKVFGVPLATINSIIKFMGRDGMSRVVNEPDKGAAQFQISPQTWFNVLKIAQELKGFPRHVGIHTGGFLISENPIHEIVPVEKASMQDRFVIQWNKDDINFLKLMKIDVLSLGMLTALRKALDLLREHKNLNYQLYQIPQEDKATYDMISKADTVGVFQIESRAQMNTLPRMQPRNFYDLVIEVALVRPGPLQGGMVHPFLKRRQGLEKVEYPHPDLEPVLKKTMGVPIFQEQIMKIAVIAAGFTPGEADELRRILTSGWSRQGLMKAVENRIMQGLAKHGVKEQYAKQVYKTIEGFGSYGFPESHAASFALLTYASCYLKCHHPEIFTCALLNSQPMGFYPPRALIADAQRHGVKFSPVDVQNSDYDYTMESPIQGLLQVRTGLRSIYGLSPIVLKKIVEERKSRGVFQNLKDFVMRTQVTRNALVILAASDALQSFNPNARELIWQIEGMSLDVASFVYGQSKESFAETPEEMPHESPWEGLQREYQSKGFSIENHPLSIIRPILNIRNMELQRQRFVMFQCSKDLEKIKHKSKVRVAGLIGMTQRPPTAKGFCFITLEDEFGFINVVIPPDVYQKDRLTIYSKSLLEVQGELEKSGPIINLKAQRIVGLVV